MRIDKNYIKNLTNSELVSEWKSRGYAEYRKKIGKVSGLGWDSMDACINYSNYESEMKDRGLL